MGSASHRLQWCYSLLKSESRHWYYRSSSGLSPWLPLLSCYLLKHLHVACDLHGNGMEAFKNSLALPRHPAYCSVRHNSWPLVLDLLPFSHNLCPLPFIKLWPVMDRTFSYKAEALFERRFLPSFTARIWPWHPCHHAVFFCPLCILETGH